MKRLLLTLLVALIPGWALAQSQCLGPNCDLSFTSSSPSAGSANAQTVQTASGGYFHRAGNSIAFVAGFSNSGPITVNIDGVGALPVKLNGADPAANVIVAGQSVFLIDDGTNLDIPSVQVGGTSSLPSGDIWVGSSSGLATPVTPSGDLSMTNLGAFTVNKIQGTTVSGVTGTGNVVFSASPTLTGTVTAPTVMAPASTDLTLSAPSSRLVIASNGLSAKVNFAGTYPRTSAGGLVMGQNLSNGSQEGNFINTQTGASISFDWRQMTGTNAGTVLMQLAPGLWSLPSAVTAQFGTFTGTPCTNSGFITINDAGGTARKVMICS